MKTNSVIKFVSILAICLAIVIVVLLLIQQPTPTPQVKEEFKKFSSLSELKNFLKENAGGYGGEIEEGLMATIGTAQKATAAEAGAGAEDFSQTNIQVAGVDEP